MKKAFSILVLILFATPSFSQLKDWNEKFLLQSTQNYLNNFADQPLRSTLIGEEFGYSGIYWDQRDGEFHSVQMPEKDRNYGFSSLGIREVNGWMIEGYFQFQNQKQDSVGWKQTRDVNESPFYYANIRKGNWRNNVFNSHINASKYFYKEKIAFGLGVDYSLQTHSRGNDPRPLINYHYIKPKAQISYQFIEKHQFAVAANILTATERGSVSNFNQSNDSFGKTEYNIYTLMGGATFNLLRRPNYELIDKGIGFGAAYYYTGNKLTINNEFDYSFIDKTFNRRGIEGSQRVFEEIGIFSVEEISNNLFVQYENDLRVLQLHLVNSQSFGKDFNNLLAGNNFQQDGSTHAIEILYEFKKINHLSVFGDVSMNNLSLRDFNASHAYEISNLSFGLGLQLPISASDKLTFYPKLKSNWRMNLNQDVNIIASQINIVSTSVLIPNIDFLSAEYFNVNAELGARIKFKKFDLNPSVFADLNTFNPPSAFNSAYFETRGNQRSTLGFSINFIH